jgi:hypothetical protein
MGKLFTIGVPSQYDRGKMHVIDSKNMRIMHKTIKIRSLRAREINYK